MNVEKLLELGFLPEEHDGHIIHFLVLDHRFLGTITIEASAKHELILVYCRSIFGGEACYFYEALLNEDNINALIKFFTDAGTSGGS